MDRALRAMTKLAGSGMPAAVIAIGVVLAEFRVIDAGPWGAVARPIAAIALLSVVVAAVVSWRLPAPAAAVVTSLVVVGAVRPAAMLLIAAALVGLVAVRRWSVILLGRKLAGSRTAAHALTVVGLAFVTLSLVGAVGSQGWPRIRPVSTVAAGGVGGESVYVLLLDGYPRVDTLSNEWGIDNVPFLEALEARGFNVDRQSTSLYHWTERAIGHLLGLDIPQKLHLSPEEERQLRRSFADAPRPAEWRAAGYAVTIIRTAIEHTTVDGALDTGQVTEFEVALLGDSAVAPFVRDWIVAQQRDRLDDSLDALVALARKEAPQVVIAHLLAPHPPFLTRPAPTCWPECGLWRSTGLLANRPVGYAAAWRDQLDYVNPRVLTAIDELIEADPGAAIVVFSDHGNRHHPEGDPEWNRNLYAIRGAPSVVVPVPVRLSHGPAD